MKTVATIPPSSETGLSEEEYRLLWATSPDAIVIMDEQGTIRYANPATLDVFGYSAARLVGNNIAIVQPERLREAHRRGVRRLLRNGGKKLDGGATETFGLHRQGHEFPIEIAFSHLSEEGGRNVFAAFIRDISDRKKIEDALRHHEAQLAEAQELAQLGSWSWDVPSDSITWSHELLRIAGLPAAPARFADLLELVPPADRAHFNEAVRRSIEDDEPYDMNVRLMRPDRSVRTVHARGQCVRDGAGAVVRMFGTALDITAREKAQAALRDSEERFRATFEKAPIGICELETDGAFERVNPRLCEMLGYSECELLALSAGDLTHPDDIAPTLALVDEVLQGKRKMFEIDKRYIRKDGTIFWAHANSTLLRDASGSPKSFIAVLEDVTSRKLAEEAIQALPAQLLKAQDEERRRIARELHDSTAQDLAVVSMNLGLIEEWMEGRDAWAANLLGDSLAVLAQANRDLRTLAHLLHPPMLDELGLAGALRHYVEGFSQRSGIQVELDSPADLARCSEEIETALFRVVQESLANVHRHSGSNSASVQLVRAGENIELTIADRGHGLPAGLRLDTAEEAGVGVGISGMRQRMRQLGGQLKITSNSAGTRVHAALPFRAREAGSNGSSK
jgi:PAS domain S-box-containing protein